MQSCWKTCCTQSPSSSALHWSGWQLSPCFHPVWGTRGRLILVPCWRRLPERRPAGWPCCIHALLIEPEVVSVELLQQLHQGLLPPMDLSLMLTGVDVLHMSSLFNLDWLVSLDHHPAHFKGAVVLIKIEILLCSDSFEVTSPHFLLTTADPLQLGIPSGSLLNGTVGDPHPLVEPLCVGPYDHLLGVWTQETIFSSYWMRDRVSSTLPCLSWTHQHPGQHHPHWQSWQTLHHGLQCSLRPWYQSIFGISDTLNWTGRGLKSSSHGLVRTVAGHQRLFHSPSLN